MLGLIIRSDMRWCSNTKNMIAKASKRLWVLRRLKNMGAVKSDLLDVYKTQIRWNWLCLLGKVALAKLKSQIWKEYRNLPATLYLIITILHILQP